jgi:hypothetical protein
MFDTIYEAKMSLFLKDFSIPYILNLCQRMLEEMYSLEVPSRGLDRRGEVGLATTDLVSTQLGA